jgi:hypothetical protein
MPRKPVVVLEGLKAVDTTIGADQTLTISGGGIINVAADGVLQLGGTQVTTEAGELNVLANVTPGTAKASSALVLGANKNVDTLAIADGGLKLGAGAGTAVTATAAELNKVDGYTGSHLELNTLVGKLAGATITVGAEDADAIAVTIQLEDANGDDMATSAAVYGYLSDNDDGSTLAGTAPDTVAIGTDGLEIELVSKKAFLLVSESDGDIDLAIGENGADTWYLVLVMPDGSLVISDAITFVGP